MTRKDYKLVAEEIKKEYKHEEQEEAGRAALMCLADQLAFRFATENQLFDRLKFLKACGVID